MESIGKELENPQVWQYRDKAAALSKELARLQETVSALQSLGEEIVSLGEHSSEQELRLLEEELKKEETKAFLSGKYDGGDAILTITAGAGGQDAQDWATMLLRMYQRYAERAGFRASMIHQSFGEQGPEGRIGTKQVSLEIRGPFAYGFLKKESGVHRLVRISPFSAQSLRHTSFASVEVLPEVNLSEEKEIEIKPDDLKVDFFRASGPGGQNVNKRETAVRITHIPTGMVTASQAQRSQQQNREKALQILASKLYQLQEQERAKELDKVKGKQAAIEWGSQIRSYVLHPYKMVKDLRTNAETSHVEAVLDGDLEEFIEREVRLPQ